MYVKTLFPVKVIDLIFWQDFNLEYGVCHAFANLHIVIIGIEEIPIIGEKSEHMFMYAIHELELNFLFPVDNWKSDGASVVNWEKGSMRAFIYWGPQKGRWTEWLFHPWMEK